MARYKGGSSAGGSLRYPVEAYVPSVAMMSKYMTEKQMISEYSRLRSIARKRLERFEGIFCALGKNLKSFRVQHNCNLAMTAFTAITRFCRK